MLIIPDEGVLSILTLNQIQTSRQRGSGVLHTQSLDLIGGQGLVRRHRFLKCAILFQLQCSTHLQVLYHIVVVDKMVRLLYLILHLLLQQMAYHADVFCPKDGKSNRIGESHITQFHLVNGQVHRLYPESAVINLHHSLTRNQMLCSKFLIGEDIMLGIGVENLLHLFTQTRGVTQFSPINPLISLCPVFKGQRIAVLTSGKDKVFVQARVRCLGSEHESSGFHSMNDGLLLLREGIYHRFLFDRLLCFPRLHFCFQLGLLHIQPLGSFFFGNCLFHFLQIVVGLPLAGKLLADTLLIHIDFIPNVIPDSITALSFNHTEPLVGFFLAGNRLDILHDLLDEGTIFHAVLLQLFSQYGSIFNSEPLRRRIKLIQKILRNGVPLFVSIQNHSQRHTIEGILLDGFEKLFLICILHNLARGTVSAKVFNTAHGHLLVFCITHSVPLKFFQSLCSSRSFQLVLFKGILVEIAFLFHQDINSTGNLCPGKLHLIAIGFGISNALSIVILAAAGSARECMGTTARAILIFQEVCFVLG